MPTDTQPVRNDGKCTLFLTAEQYGRLCDLVIATGLSTEEAIDLAAQEFLETHSELPRGRLSSAEELRAEIGGSR